MPLVWFCHRILGAVVQRIPRILARMVTCGVLISMVTGVVSAPAWAEPVPGTCVGGEFTAKPPSGSAVAPGKKIVYYVTVVVEGDTPVLGCSRTVLLSTLLEFVSVKPDGAYFPNTTVGPLASIDFVGPFDPGTILRGRLTMKVAADAPAGAIIEVSSLDVIRHVVEVKD
jgi:hypothetical protein